MASANISLEKEKYTEPNPPIVYGPSSNIPEWNVCRCGEAVFFFGIFVVVMTMFTFGQEIIHWLVPLQSHLYGS